DHEQAVAGDEEQLVGERLRQEGRDRDRLALRTEDEAGAVLDHEGETECQQQAVERIASIERSDQDAFDRESQDCGERWSDQQRAPEPDIGRKRVRYIAADDEEAAMGEV